MVKTLLGLLGILFIYYFIFFARDIYRSRKDLGYGSFPVSACIGFVTNFLDTLGIGSYATTTMLLNMTHQLKTDKHLPGTLNVSCTIPVLVEAFIFITVVKVEALTLFSLVIAAICGAIIGSRTVTKLPEKSVQLYMGIALLITAALMVAKQLGWLSILGSGNTALGLSGIRLIIGIIGNFVFGMLMTIGVGLYAPCMAMVYLLGLSPIIAFPVMMASCAGLMPVASKEFIVAGDYARKVSVAIALGGLFGVIIATKFVTSLDLNILTWIVIAVIIYTGILYIRKGKKK